MTFSIINGTHIAQKIYDDLSTQIRSLPQSPRLGVILVGDNTESLRYIAQKKKWAEVVGISFELFHYSSDINQEELLKHIYELNNDTSIDGFMVQTPLPHHIHTQDVLNAIDPQKDVDGFHPENQGKIMIGDHTGLVPCTPAGIMHIFGSENIDLKGKKITVVGRSNIVGKPLINLCINAGATVTACNSHTKDLSLYTRGADIVVLATGQPGLVTIDMVEKNTIIIDVGFSVIEGKIYGDACFEELLKNGNLITPVPGGVGPMTVAMLMRNTLQAYLQKSLEK